MTANVAGTLLWTVLVLIGLGDPPCSPETLRFRDVLLLLLVLGLVRLIKLGVEQRGVPDYYYFRNEMVLSSFARS